MSIVGTLFAGAAGMRSHTDAMGIVSDNIANVNTVGYKTARGNFSDFLGGMIAGTRVAAHT